MKSISWKCAFVLPLAGLVFVSGCGKSEVTVAPMDDMAGNSREEAPKPKPKPRETFELKAKWPAGKRVLQTHSHDLAISMTQGTREQKVNVVMGLDVAHDIGEASPEGGHKVWMEVLGFRVESKDESSPFKFDSAMERKEDRKHPLFKDFRKVVGNGVNYRTNERGDVVAVEDYDTFIARSTRVSSPGAIFMIKMLLGQDLIKECALTTAALPTEKVGMGDTWETVEERQIGGQPAKITTSYNFLGWEDRGGGEICAGIEFESLAVIKQEGEESTETTEGGQTRMTTPAKPKYASAEEEARARESMARAEAYSMDVDPNERNANSGATPDGETGTAAEMGMTPEDPNAPAEPPADPKVPGQIGKSKGKLFYNPDIGLMVAVDETTEAEITMSQGQFSMTSSVASTRKSEITGTTEIPAEK